MPKVNREDLLRALESVSAGLTPKALVEQGDKFVFVRGWVKTYNDEISCSAPVPALADLGGAVTAQPLLDLLNKMVEEELTVEAGDGEVVVAGNRRRAGLTMDAEVTLPLAQVEIPKKSSWRPLPADFCEAAQVVQACASADENMFKLTCVHLHPDYIEASDDFQLCRWNMATGVARKTLVRRAAVNAAAALGVTEFAETPCWFHFRNPTKARLSCRRYDEEFPDVGKWFKVGKADPKIALPKGLPEALEKAEVFSQQHEDNFVLVELRPGKLKVKARGVNGWYEESKKLSGYEGGPRLFSIPPKLLSELAARHNECRLADNRLVVDAGAYKYASLLLEPAEPAKVKSEAAAGGDND